MIVAKAEGASNQAMQVAPERLTRLEKPNRDVKLGLRFGLHPQTKQVVISRLGLSCIARRAFACAFACIAVGVPLRACLARVYRVGTVRVGRNLRFFTKQVVISELYSGYPAQQSGRIFMGDVVTSINGVKVADVEMAAQIIKLTAGARRLPPTAYRLPPTAYRLRLTRPPTRNLGLAYANPNRRRTL